MEEAVFVYHFGRGFGVLVVALHGVVATVAHLALHADGAFQARLGVDDAHFGVLEVAAHGGVAHFGGVVNARVRHAR